MSHPLEISDLRVMVFLDLDHLKKIVGNDPAFLRQVLQIFVANAPKDVADLSRFAEEGDHEKVAFFAHKLKSASGAIGFNEAYEAFKEIEAMGKEMAPIEEIREKVDAMASHCLDCMTDIETIMSGL
jgi:HPt (histidine-containing phosphotransfer) domain-containing protein